MTGSDYRIQQPYPEQVPTCHAYCIFRPKIRKRKKVERKKKKGENGIIFSPNCTPLLSTIITLFVIGNTNI